MKDTTIGIISVIGIVVFVISTISYSLHLSGLRQTDFEEELSNMGISIQKGSVKSPAIMIILENKSAFFEKAIELEATMVYYTPGGKYWGSVCYYVFTEDYNIAYKLDLG